MEKYFLIQLKERENDYPKSITMYEGKETALAAFHDTCGANYKATDVLHWTVMLINPYGGTEALATWDKETPEPQEG